MDPLAEVKVLFDRFLAEYADEAQKAKDLSDAQAVVAEKAPLAAQAHATASATVAEIKAKLDQMET